MYPITGKMHGRYRQLSLIHISVTHGAGPCLVLAGPGSGKTLTIVNRMKYLIEERKVRPEEILVITFTKYAAAEMKSRFQQLMGNKGLPVTVGTFHGCLLYTSRCV